MQSTQNKLLQHGVSTASWKMSRQMGQSHLSSERLLAEKLLNLWWIFVEVETGGVGLFASIGEF